VCYFVLSLFQASLNAREGRVMIFNLVEAAQEFLSRIEPIAKPTESVSLLLLTYYFLLSYCNYYYSLKLVIIKSILVSILFLMKMKTVEVSDDVL
jgi:hypothetical protein